MANVKQLTSEYLDAAEWLTHRLYQLTEGAPQSACWMDVGPGNGTAPVWQAHVAIRGESFEACGSTPLAVVRGLVRQLSATRPYLHPTN